MTSLALALAIGASGAWAVGMVLAKPALRHADPLTFLVLRWGVVLVLALGFGLAANGFAFGGWRAVGFAVLAGLLDAVGGGLFYLLAMERASSYQTTTLSSTTPLWGVVGSVLALGEPVQWSAFVAAATVVGGAVLLVHRSSGDAPRRLSGAVFGLAAGILWGVGETVPAKLALSAGMDSASLLLVLAGTAILGGLLLTPALRPRFPRRLDRAGVGYAIASGGGGAFLGWVLWLAALGRAPASLLSPLQGSKLLFAFLLSVLLLRERPAARSVLGCALIFAGVLLVTLAR